MSEATRSSGEIVSKRELARFAALSERDEAQPG